MSSQFDKEQIFYIYIYIYICVCTGVLISPYPDQEGNKLQRQKILPQATATEDFDVHISYL
jgi:hypothetical protein